MPTMTIPGNLRPLPEVAAVIGISPWAARRLLAANPDLEKLCVRLWGKRLVPANVADEMAKLIADRAK